METQTDVQQVVQTDPMAAEMAALEAAIAAEEGAAPATTTDAPVVAEPATPSAAAIVATPDQPAEPAAKAPSKEVAAIIAMRKQLQQVQAQNLLLQGQAQAYASMAQGQAATQAEPEVAEVDPLQAIHADRVALAEAFDAGDITAKEWEIKRAALDTEEWELRTASLQPVVQAAPVTDLSLEKATAQLEVDYPVLKQPWLSEEMLEPLSKIARHQAQAQGKPIQPGALGTLELRQRIAKLAQDMYGGGVSTTQQPAAPALSADAQARAQKLDAAAAMPPDVSKMGSAAVEHLSSEAEILSRMEGLTEDQQWALMKTLPSSVRTALGV